MLWQFDGFQQKLLFGLVHSNADDQGGHHGPQRQDQACAGGAQPDM